MTFLPFSKRLNRITYLDSAIKKIYGSLPKSPPILSHGILFIQHQESETYRLVK